MPSSREQPVPLTLGAGERVGIVAGGGALPEDVALRLAERGHRPFVLALAGEGVDPTRYAHAELDHASLEEMGLFVGRLKQAGVTHVVLAGAVTRRPQLRRIKWNLGFLSLVRALVPALRRGDDGALRAVISHFEKHGLKVVGAHEFAPDLVAEAGVVTAAQPLTGDWPDIDAARAAALAIGTLDIGQAAIAIGGRAVALEGIEGTDGLLERTVSLRTHGRLAKRTRGVIAKCAKPGQEFRADLPAIGPGTVEGAHAAGLAGIVVEAGRTLILKRRETIEAADRLGLFILALLAGQARP